MSEIRSKLETALKEAMRSGDDRKKQTIRMALSTIKLAEVEKGASGNAMDDAGVIAVLQKEIKARKEAILDAEKAGRNDLIEIAHAETLILEAFLPAALSDEDLNELVKSAIVEANAVAPTDMGKVMKVLMPKIKGRAAGDRVNAAVKALLTK